MEETVLTGDRPVDPERLALAERLRSALSHPEWRSALRVGTPAARPLVVTLLSDPFWTTVYRVHSHADDAVVVAPGSGDLLVVVSARIGGGVAYSERRFTTESSFEDVLSFLRSAPGLPQLCWLEDVPAVLTLVEDGEPVDVTSLGA